MNNGISKAQPRRSRVRLSKCLQEQLLNAIAIPSPAAAGLPQDAQQPEVEGEGAQPADKVRPHTLLWDQVLTALGRRQSSSIRNQSLRTPTFSRNLSIPSSRVLAPARSAALFLSGSNRLGPTEIYAAGQIATFILQTTAPSRDSSRDQHRRWPTHGMLCSAADARFNCILFTGRCRRWIGYPVEHHCVLVRTDRENPGREPPIPA